VPDVNSKDNDDNTPLQWACYGVTLREQALIDRVLMWTAGAMLAIHLQAVIMVLGGTEALMDRGADVSLPQSFE
jgi:ankyrin repeat protein